MDNVPPFSVCQYTTYPQTWEQDVALYAQLGVDGIEVCEEKLSTDPVLAGEQLAMLRDHGIKVTSVQPAVLGLFATALSSESEPRDPAERMARFRQTIDLIARTFPGEDIPLVTGGAVAPDMNYRLAHRTARELYPPLADYAADHGVRIMFEPLSPVLMNFTAFICSLAEAMQLIEDVDRPNFGLCLDVWHVWREANVPERIVPLGERIFGVHVCDWPAAEPRSALDRVLPGAGVIDLPGMLGAIDASGYKGAYCLEIFSAEQFPDSLWRVDPCEVIEQGRKAFFDCWRKRCCDEKS
jgi:sugar phosphate isomerase/epimerase